VVAQKEDSAVIIYKGFVLEARGKSAKKSTCRVGPIDWTVVLFDRPSWIWLGTSRKSWLVGLFVRLEWQRQGNDAGQRWLPFWSHARGACPSELDDPGSRCGEGLVVGSRLAAATGRMQASLGAVITIYLFLFNSNQAMKKKNGKNVYINLIFSSQAKGHCPPMGKRVHVSVERV
jgi:hypothetical protein